MSRPSMLGLVARGRTRRAAFAVLLAPAAAALAVSCEGETKAALAPQPAATLPQAAVTTGRRLFVRPPLPPEPWHAENRRRVDPAADGWPLEAFHDRAKAVLDPWLAALWSVDAAPEKLASVLDPAFEVATALRPAELETLRNGGGIVVRRAATIPRERRAVEALPELAAALREPFGSARASCESQFDRVVALDGAVETEARIRAWSVGGNGVVQQVARWRMRWVASGEGAPRLREVEVLSFEEASSPRALFADHTGRCLGTQPWIEREVRQGMEEHFFRHDRIAEFSLLGFQGLAVGDLDGDGLEDLYLCMPSGVPNRLLLHLPDGSTRDATADARVGYLDDSRSALIVDLDGDGARDLAVAVGAFVALAFNDGKAGFPEQALLRCPGGEEIYSLAAADPDRDGDLDLYGCRYVQGGLVAGVPTPYDDARNGATNVYFRNEGGRRFSDATVESGFASANDRFSLAALWEDLDDDGDLDLYVANDFGRNNLFLNEDGRFRDVAGERGAEDMAAGMGVTSADFDLDGVLDLYVSNMESGAGLRMTRPSGPGSRSFLPQGSGNAVEAFVRHARGNTLLRGLGGGKFEDVTEAAGCAEGGWAWGAMFADFDGDGFEDLFSPNGFTSGSGAYDLESFFWRRVVGQSPLDARPSEPYRQGWASLQRLMIEDLASYNGHQRDAAWLNLGGGRFADVGACSGLDFAGDSRAVALVDWDDDGRQDLVLRSRTAPRVRFLLNRCGSADTARFLAVELAGSGGNRDAIGARVLVEAGGRKLRKTLHAGEGFLAQSSRRLLFGLGSAEKAERLDVRWPDGSTSTFTDLAANTRYRVRQGEAAPEVIAPRTARAFATAPPTPLEPSSAPVDRVVLVEKVPLAPLPLPMIAGGAKRVRDFAGKPLLILCWSSASEESVRKLEELAARRGDLERAGLTWLPITFDEGPSLVAARRKLAELGLEQASGYADGPARKAFEILWVEALGRSSDVADPSAFLLDAAGQWVIGYLGAVEIERVLADAPEVAALPTGQPRAPKLLGGRWVLRRDRDWKMLSAIFRELGAAELAELYRSRAAPPDGR